MLLFVKGGAVLAQHDEGQAVSASQYGAEVVAIAVPDATPLPRLGGEAEAAALPGLRIQLAELQAAAAATLATRKPDMGGDAVTSIETAAAGIAAEAAQLREQIAAAERIIAARPLGLPPMVGAVLAYAVKYECGRRIAARLSDAAQRNMTTYGALAASAVATPQVQSDLETLRAIFAWVGRPDGMQGQSDKLIAAGDVAFTSDARWPAWSPAWSDFVARF